MSIHADTQIRKVLTFISDCTEKKLLYPNIKNTIAIT